MTEVRENDIKLLQEEDRLDINEKRNIGGNESCNEKRT